MSALPEGTIVIPKSVLQDVFDIAIHSMDFGSDLMSDTDHESLIEAALALGVDPVQAMPRKTRCEYRRDVQGKTGEEVHEMGPWNEREGTLVDGRWVKPFPNPCTKCGYQAVEHTPDPEDSRIARMICMKEACRHVWNGVPDRGPPPPLPITLWRWCIDCKHEEMKPKPARCVAHTECEENEEMGIACAAASAAKETT